MDRYGTEVMHRSSFQVPAIVGAYNSFMNSVDRMDQLRSACPTRRREKRVSMTMLTLILDLSILNSRAVYNKLCLGDPFTVTAFKQKLCEQLVTPALRERQSAPTVQPVPYEQPRLDAVLGVLNTTHYIINLSFNAKGRQADAHCYLCLLFGKKLKTRFGCMDCQKAFHPTCYTAFHNKNALSNDRRTMIDLVIRGGEENGRLNRPCRHVGGLETMDLLFLHKGRGDE
jgi:hypothetical protein